MAKLTEEQRKKYSTKYASSNKIRLESWDGIVWDIIVPHKIGDDVYYTCLEFMDKADLKQVSQYSRVIKPTVGWVMERDSNNGQGGIP